MKKQQIQDSKKGRRDWKEQLLHAKDVILIDDEHRASALVPVVTPPEVPGQSQKKWRMQWNRWRVLLVAAIVAGAVLIIAYFVSQYEQIKAVSR